MGDRIKDAAEHAKDSMRDMGHAAQDAMRR
jgi:hypothetical protein